MIFLQKKSYEGHLKLCHYNNDKIIMCFFNPPWTHVRKGVLFKCEFYLEIIVIAIASLSGQLVDDNCL